MNRLRSLLPFLVFLSWGLLRCQSVSLPVLGCNCTEDSKYNFRVTLANDSVVKTKSKMERDPNTGYYYIFYKAGNETRRLYPRDTKRLEVSDYANMLMAGRPADTAWLFNTDSGRISLYALYPIYKTENAVAIQAGPGAPILTLCKENLLPMIQEDDKARKTAEKGKLQRAVVLYNLGEK